MTTETLWPPIAGRYGKTRDGRKVGPFRPRSDGPFGAEFMAPCEQIAGSNYGYFASGRRVYDAMDPQSDLISEWIDDPAPIDFSKIRVGDRVRLGGEFVVDGFDRLGARLRFGASRAIMPVPSEAIVAHIPAAKTIEVGCEVAIDGGGRGEVIAIWEGSAWVRHLRGGELTTDLPHTYPFDRINRIGNAQIR